MRARQRTIKNRERNGRELGAGVACMRQRERRNRGVHLRMAVTLAHSPADARQGHTRECHVQLGKGVQHWPTGGALDSLATRSRGGSAMLCSAPKRGGGRPTM